MNIVSCDHCRDTEYVLEYPLENTLLQNGIHMTDIPPDIFKKIPVELLRYCHCNVRILFFPRQIKAIHCSGCEDTTWQFSEKAKQKGYYSKKVRDLSRNDLKSLPCDYFERCPCTIDEQGFRGTKRKKALNEIFESLKIRIPRFGFGF